MKVFASIVTSCCHYLHDCLQRLRALKQEQNFEVPFSRFFLSDCPDRMFCVTLGWSHSRFVPGWLVSRCREEGPLCLWGGVWLPSTRSRKGRSLLPLYALDPRRCHGDVQKALPIARAPFLVSVTVSLVCVGGGAGGTICGLPPCGHL